MRYRCAHCDLAFESTEQLVRCPKCLRKSGIEAERPVTAIVQRGAHPLILIAGLFSALAELGAFLYGKLDPPSGVAGILMIVGCLFWGALSALMVVAGLRGVLSRMQ